MHGNTYQAMETLPSELLCNILSKLDGRSLLAAAQVCCQWQDLVQLLSSSVNIWFHCCTREININTLVAVTGRTELIAPDGVRKTDTTKEEWEYWKDVYLQYYHYTILDQCQVVRKSQINLPTLLKGDSGLVTSLGAADKNTFVMCHKSGLVYTVMNAYQHTLDNLQFHLLPLHSHSVSDVGVVKPEGHGNTSLIVTVDLAGYINLCSFDGVSKAQLRVSSKHIKSVCTFGKYFALGMHASMVSGVQIYRVEWQGEHLQVDSILRLSGLLYSDVNAVALTHDKVVAGDLQGVIYVWKIPSLARMQNTAGSTRNPTTWESEAQHVREPTQCLQMEASIAQIATCQDNCVILLSNKVVMVLREDGKLLRILVSALGDAASVHAEPMCLATEGPILGVGCQHGIVLLFNTDKDRWWTNLRWSLMSTVRTHVGHVISLVITYSGTGAVVLAGGGHVEVYCYSLPSMKDLSLPKQDISPKEVALEF